MSRRLRTRKGNVTATARKRYGNRRGKFPVFDARSARSALKLRGRGKGVSKRSVVNKVSRFANRTHNASLKAAVRRARKVDRSR